MFVASKLQLLFWMCHIPTLKRPVSLKFTIFLALRYRKFRIFAIPKKNEEISFYICPDGRLAVLNGRRAQL